MSAEEPIAAGVREFLSGDIRLASVAWDALGLDEVMIFARWLIRPG